MKNTLLSGTIVLACAGLFCKALGAIYRIPLSNILGAEGIGLYQMVYAVFAFFLVVASGGVSATVCHKVAAIRAGGAGSEKAVFLQGVAVSAAVSGALAIFLIVFGRNIAAFQGAVGGAWAYAAAGIGLFFASALTSFRGLFQGRQNMVPTALSQTIEQAGKVLFGLCFAAVLVKKGVAWGVFGAMGGIAISEALALGFLALKTRKCTFCGEGKTSGFLKTNFQVTCGAMVVPALAVVESFLVVNILSTYFSAGQSVAMYGLASGIVASLVNFPVVISVAIALVALPALTGCFEKSDEAGARGCLGKMILSSLAVLCPIVLGFMFFADEIFMVLYPSLGEGLRQTAVWLLKISSVEVVFISLSQIFVSVFQSKGRSGESAMIFCVVGVGKILLLSGLLFVKSINIFALAISTVAFWGIVAVLSAVRAHRFVRPLVEQRSLVELFVAVGLLGVGFWVISEYALGLWVKIGFVVVAAVGLYILPLWRCNFLGVKDFLKNFRRGR